MLTHFQVLQEESERVCGKHLPDEIVWMILYKWGGLQTPAGAAIRNLMKMSQHNTLGQRHRPVPYGTFSQSDVGDLISQEQLHDPSTEFVMHVSNVRLVRRTVATENLSDLFNPYANSLRSTTQGPVLVRASLPFLLHERTTPMRSGSGKGWRRFIGRKEPESGCASDICGPWRPSAVGFQR